MVLLLVALLTIASPFPVVPLASNWHSGPNNVPEHTIIGSRLYSKMANNGGIIFCQMVYISRSGDFSHFRFISFSSRFSTDGGLVSGGNVVL